MMQRPSIYPSISIYLSIYREEEANEEMRAIHDTEAQYLSSIHLYLLSIYLYLSTYLSIYLSIYLFIYREEEANEEMRAIHDTEAQYLSIYIYLSIYL